MVNIWWWTDIYKHKLHQLQGDKGSVSWSRWRTWFIIYRVNGDMEKALRSIQWAGRPLVSGSGKLPA